MRIDEAVVQHLKSTVVGEIDGLDSIGSSILIHGSGLSPEDKPAGSFFMSGPTGVGKTWLAESLAEFLHGECKLLRIDCGAYTGDHDVAKLVGAPPGYLGHKETPPLLCAANVTEVYKSAKSKLTVILFDEIDKAAASLPKLLLSVLDKGFLRTGDNMPVSYRDALVFFTSNHGQSSIHKLDEVPIGFGGEAVKEATQDVVAALTKKAIVKTLPPEFINRVDNWLHFSPLRKQDIYAILQLEINKIARFINMRVAGTDQKITLTDSAVEWLINNGYSKEYGARPLKRLLRKEVLERIAIQLASGKVSKKINYVFNSTGTSLELVTKVAAAA